MSYHQRPSSRWECQTEFRAYLLCAWLDAANDPARDICRWLWEGAPAGITEGFDELDGIMPRVDGAEPKFAPDELTSDIDTFVNYAGVESDEAVKEQIDKYENKGWLLPFETAKHVVNYLGSDFIITKMGAVKKVKPDGSI